MKRCITALVLAALVSPASSQTTDLKVAVAKCRAVAESLQRLVCYDKLAGEGEASGAGTSTTPTTPQALTAALGEKPARETVSRRCAATTKKGAQCSRMAKPGSAYCWQHGG